MLSEATAGDGTARVGRNRSGSLESIRSTYSSPGFSRGNAAVGDESRVVGDFNFVTAGEDELSQVEGTRPISADILAAAEVHGCDLCVTMLDERQRRWVSGRQHVWPRTMPLVMCLYMMSLCVCTCHFQQYLRVSLAGHLVTAVLVGASVDGVAGAAWCV